VSYQTLLSSIDHILPDMLLLSMDSVLPDVTASIDHILPDVLLLSVDSVLPDVTVECRPHLTRRVVVEYGQCLTRRYC